MTPSSQTPWAWLSLLSRRLAGVVAVAATLALAATGPTASGAALPKVSVKPLFTLTAGMTAPTDVAIGPDDWVYVLDGVNQRVRVFDASGRLVRSLGGFGGTGSMATGLAVSSTGNVYVADPALHRVQVLSRSGALLKSWLLPSGDNGSAGPTDVVLDETDGRAFVVDNDNHRLHVLSLSSGKLIRWVGGDGAGRGHFRFPFLGAYDPVHRHVLVAETLNTRVQVLTTDGSYVDTVGTFGVNRGQFFRPKGVAVDSSGRAWVSDGYLGVVQVFDGQGDFVGAMADVDSGALIKLTTPTGVAIDSRGRVYVVEAMKDRVQAYVVIGGGQ